MRCGLLQAHAAAAILVLAALAPRALADEVVMRNGARFEGRVIKETDHEVVFQTAEGTITMRRSLIREILRKPWPAAEPADAKTAKSKAAAKQPAKRSSRKTPIARKPATRSAKKAASRRTTKSPG